MTMIKNRIGEIGCADDFGEALAYAVYCVRADRFPHPDNDGRHAVAHMDMLRHMRHSRCAGNESDKHLTASHGL